VETRKSLSNLVLLYIPVIEPLIALRTLSLHIAVALRTTCLLGDHRVLCRALGSEAL